MTKEELFNLKPKKINSGIYNEVKLNWDKKAKPLEGLGQFERITSQILAINERVELPSLKKVLVVMCGDHGIVEEGVSQCGQEVTLSVAKLLGINKSTASKMAAFSGTDCIPVDVGINTSEKLEGVRDCKVRPGTENFLKGPAMSQEEAIKAIEAGINIARECKEKGYNLLATGEMGIGNTTAGTAVLCALTGVSVESFTGRGAGLSNEGLNKKIQVIKKALSKYGFDSEGIGKQSLDDKEYALDVMAKVGGLELAAMTGLFIGGAVYGLPVMIDGALSAVSALTAKYIMPESLGYMIPSHSGREKATGYVLDVLGLKPLINGDMALGEGTGALMAIPPIEIALDYYSNATSFEEGKIQQYVRQDTE